VGFSFLLVRIAGVGFGRTAELSADKLVSKQIKFVASTKLAVWKHWQVVAKVIV